MPTVSVVACSTCSSEIPRTVRHCGHCGAENFGGRPLSQPKRVELRPEAPPDQPAYPLPAAASAAVIVTDVQMPFGSMVVFMVKWALASIPAMIILFAVGLVVGLFLMALVAPGAGSFVP